VNRLLATAVVNHQFQSKLLNEPSTALEGGYLDRSFSLTDEERDIILSIQTDSLQDFARKLLEAFKEQPVAIKQVSYAVVR